VADAHTHVQRLVSIVKMTTVFEGYITEEQCSVVRFCGQKDTMQKISIKKCFLFTVGSVCRLERFSLGGKRFTDDEKVETEVRKWPRPQSRLLSCRFQITGTAMGHVNFA
jgi:hypothetical protein